MGAVLWPADASVCCTVSSPYALHSDVVALALAAVRFGGHTTAAGWALTDTQSRPFAFC